MNCPFYGRAFVPVAPYVRDQPPFLLLDQHGNQCALIVTSHAPCRMEMEGETPDWQACALVRYAVRG